MAKYPDNATATPTGDAVIAQLKRLKRRGADLSFTGQRGTATYRSACQAFKSYRQAVEAAGIDYASVARRRGGKWDRPTIIKRLRAIAKAGGVINSRGIRVTESQLFAAAVHWFGSYRAAIEAAGLDYANVRLQDPQRWSREAVVRELRRLRRQRAPLHPAAIGRDRPELVTAAYRYFGNYRKAVEAAGLNYLEVRTRPQRTWNGKRVVSEIRRLKRDGVGLWARSVRAKQSYLPRAAKDLFGSYPAAARAAGVMPAALRPPPYRIWSRDRVIDALRKMAKRDVNALAPTRMRASNSYLVRAAARRFGSYRRAVEAAGVDYDAIARTYAEPMPAAEILARLQTLERQGKDLRYTALNRSEPRLLNAARRRYGSYELAVRAAGIPYPPLPPLRHWTEAMVLGTLRDLHARGEDLRYQPIKRHRLPLYEAAKYYFGSYTNAVRLAGVSYTPMAEAQRVADRRRKLAAYRAARRPGKR